MLTIYYALLVFTENECTRRGKCDEHCRCLVGMKSVQVAKIGPMKNRTQKTIKTIM